MDARSLRSAWTDYMNARSLDLIVPLTSASNVPCYASAEGSPLHIAPTIQTKSHSISHGSHPCCIVSSDRGCRTGSRTVIVESLLCGRVRRSFWVRAHSFRFDAHCPPTIPALDLKSSWEMCRYLELFACERGIVSMV
jgi:hypothetical protein